MYKTEYTHYTLVLNSTNTCDLTALEINKNHHNTVNFT